MVDRNSIFIPSGYDSFELVNQSLVGSQARWPTDKLFEKIVPAPAEDTDDATLLLAADVRVDSHEQWLEKLEKAAGAGLEELQKQSVEASKKTEQAAVARRAAADRRKREEKDVSSKHLQNFFNNLLSRPEKTRSSRSMSDKKVEFVLPGTFAVICTNGETCSSCVFTCRRKRATCHQVRSRQSARFRLTVFCFSAKKYLGTLKSFWC